MPSTTDNEYAALAATYGAGLSLQDMRMKQLGGPTTPGKSTTDLEYAYFVSQGGSALNSRSDNESKYWPGNNSLSDDKFTAGSALSQTLTNLCTNPTPGGSIAGWGTNSDAGWVHTLVAGEIQVNRLAAADPDFANYAASMWGTGTPNAPLILPAGVKYQRSVEVWTDLPTASVAGGIVGAFVGGQQLPANQWTRVVEQFTGTGISQYVTGINILSPGVGTGMHVKLRRAQLMENPSGQTQPYFDGSTPDTAQMDYEWTGAVNASTSTAKSKPASAGPAVSIDQLMAVTPFYIGHRGSGEIWPEHTQVAYQGAVDGGAKALEWSVQRGIEGRWFHLHNAGSTGLNATTDRTGDPSQLTNAQIDTTHVVQPQLGYYWQQNPPLMPKFLDMMDLFFNKVVIFIEPKDYSVGAIDALLQILAQYPRYTESMIWKMHVTGSYGLAQARAAGMKTWAYMDYPLVPQQLTDAIARGDYIGIPKFDGAVGFESGLTPAEVDTVIAAAGTKKVIAWPPTRRNIIAGLVAQGVDGLVSATVPYTLRTPPSADRTSDQFGSGKWAPGDLGFDASRTFKVTQFATALFDTTATNPSVMLGSFCPIGPDTYQIDFEFKYDVVPGPTLHSGIAFCKPDDKRFQFQYANEGGGYHAVLRQNGQLQLYKHDPGITAGTQLGATIATAVLDTTTWAHIKVTVSPTTITVQRTDGTPSTVITSSDTTYRGKYIHLSRNHVSSALEYVHFRNVAVT